MPKSLKYCDFDFAKIQDSKGGFIYEEEKERISVLATNCMLCGSIDTDVSFKSAFQLDYCHSCARKVDLLTKTECKQDYLLSDYDLKPLKFMQKKKVHEMKLYIKSQVEQQAIKKWKSIELLDQEILKREDEKQERKQSRFADKMKKLRTKSMVTNLIREDHKHEFESKNGIQSCSCGFQMEYETIDF